MISLTSIWMKLFWKPVESWKKSVLCLRLGQENYHFPAISCSIQERFLKKWKKKLKGNLSEKNLRSKQCENKFHKIMSVVWP